MAARLTEPARPNLVPGKYRGVAVFTSTVTQRGASGASTVKPVVIVYQVWSP